MRSILIVNPKGGAGKTTLATNLAGGLASAGDDEVRLWDLDRQHSALAWLALRPADRPIIRSLVGTKKEHGQSARSRTGWLILDAPAGIRGKMLQRALRIVNKVIVPIQPSIFDMAASRDFLLELLEEKAVRKHKCAIGIVGMRVDPRTRAASTLGAYLQQYDLPMLTWLRDTQTYANAAFKGLSIFDLPVSISGRDTEQWRPILEWVTD
ncbi:MAG: ParA family protein [Betaproteobacteria bacterium]|jgi:chromosome partitioning protein|nr:MAG: ParA family protein [Betaproteobacteria bacterium]